MLSLTGKVTLRVRDFNTVQYSPHHMCDCVCKCVHSVKGLVCLMSQRETVSQCSQSVCVSVCERVSVCESAQGAGESGPRFCLLHLPEPAWGRAPPRPQLFVYNINADHCGSTHNGPNCRLQL